MDCVKYDVISSPITACFCVLDVNIIGLLNSLIDMSLCSYK